MSKNKIWIVGILGLSLFLGACGGKSEGDAMIPDELKVPENINYTTVTVERGDLAITEAGEATVEYPLSTELTWDVENSIVKEIRGSAGKSVKQGEVLAVFEAQVSPAEKADLELQVKRKKEAFDKEKTQRQAEIAAKEVQVAALSSHARKIAEQELEVLRVALEQYLYQAGQEVQDLQKRLDDLYARKKEMTLVAPFDGTVKHSYLEVGQRVMTKTAVFSLYSEEFYYIKVTDAPERFRYGMPVNLIVGKQENTKKSYPGIVVSAPNVSPAEQSQDYVYIQLQGEVNPAEFFSAVRYEVVTRQLEDVLIVDQKALHRQGNLVYANILEDGAVKKRYVTEGWKNSEVSWIVDGLSEGQVLVME